MCHGFLSVFQFLRGNVHGVFDHLREAVRSAANIPSPKEDQKKFQAMLGLMDMAVTLLAESGPGSLGSGGGVPRSFPRTRALPTPVPGTILEAPRRKTRHG